LKVPRDITGSELALQLRILGYEVVRTTGNHQRLTTTLQGEHHITIPLHKPLRLGTLSSILLDVAEHFQVTREELLRQLFGRMRTFFLQAVFTRLTAIIGYSRGSPVKMNVILDRATVSGGRSDSKRQVFFPGSNRGVSPTGTVSFWYCPLTLYAFIPSYSRNIG